MGSAINGSAQRIPMLCVFVCCAVLCCVRFTACNQNEVPEVSLISVHHRKTLYIQCKKNQEDSSKISKSYKSHILC